MESKYLAINKEINKTTPSGQSKGQPHGKAGDMTTKTTANEVITLDQQNIHVLYYLKVFSADVEVAVNCDDLFLFRSFTCRISFSS